MDLGTILQSIVNLLWIRFVNLALLFWISFPHSVDSLWLEYVSKYGDLLSFLNCWAYMQSFILALFYDLRCSKQCFHIHAVVRWHCDACLVGWHLVEWRVRLVYGVPRSRFCPTGLGHGKQQHSELPVLIHDKYLSY